MNREVERLKAQLASCRSRINALLREQEHYRRRVEQRRAELYQAKKTLETTLDTLPSGVLVIDGEMNVQLMNHSLKRMFGVKEKRVVGRKCYSVMLNSSFPCKGLSCRRVLKSRVPATEELVLFLEEDKRLFEVKTLPWESENGAFGVVRTFTDITNTRMSQEYKVLAGISSYMAHTVRNSLMPMGGFLKLLEERPLDDQQRLYLNYIYRSLFSLEDAVSEYTYYIKVKGELSYHKEINLPVELQKAAILFAKGEIPNEHRMRDVFERVSVNWLVNSQASFVVKGDSEVFRKGLLFLLKAASELAVERGVSHPVLQVEGNPTLGGWELALLVPSLTIREGMIHSMIQPWRASLPEDAFPHWGVAIFSEVVEKHGGKLSISNTPKGLVFSALFKP